MSHTAHFVQVFHTDRRLVAAIGDYLREGFMAGETCVAVLTNEHRAHIETQLIEAGFDPEVLSAEYRYIPLDAEAMLATFFDRRSGFNRARFHDSCGLLVRQAAARGQPVRLCGEMVDLLAAQGRPAAAIQLEELWNELSRHHNFRMFCTYHGSAFTENPRYRKLLHTVHSHVLPEDA